MRPLAVHLSILAALAGAVCFTNLGGPRLWDRDEPRNAGCAAEMLARGDWVTPVFDGQLRTHKPVLLYWFMIAAYETFGVNEFAARFWSAMLGVGTVLCTYFIGRRLFNPLAGLWAGVVLATALMFGVASRAATPDSVLIFLTTLATLVYVSFAFSRESPATDVAVAGLFPRAWYQAALLYSVMGLAVLAKGPVGMILPMAVIGMYLLIARLPKRESVAETKPTWLRRAWSIVQAMARPFAPAHFLKTLWSMRPLTAIAMVLLVAGPWYVLVGMRTGGAWLEGFFLEHNLGRAAGAMEGHNGPIIYYPLAILVGLFPWSILCGPTLISLVRSLRSGGAWRPGYLFAACWVGVYVGLFSVASTKLPSYITPCYPGAALLIGCLLQRWTSGEAVLRRFDARAAWLILGGVGLAMAIGAPIAAHFLLPGEEWLGAIGLVLVAGAALAWKFSDHQPRKAGVALAAAAACFAVAIFAFGAGRVDRHRGFDRLLAAVKERGSETPVGSYQILEPSWVFYAGRPIEELVHRPGGDTPRAFTTTPAGERVRRPDLHSFLAADERAVVITTDEHYENIRDELSADVTILAESPYFLKGERLLLLGRTQEAIAQRQVARKGMLQ